MGIEGGSSNREVQSQEIQQANSEQNELNQADHKRSGEELEANSTIDNEGERKQIEGREEATDSKDGNVSRLDDAETIEDEGVPFYMHPTEYWDYNGNREAEVFANCFSMYSSNIQESCEFMKSYFPKTWESFLDGIKGGAIDDIN